MLDEVAANVERSAKHIETQFSAIIGEEMIALRRALQAVVDFHAAKERDVLIATLEAGRAPPTWTLEGVALRRAMAAEFKDCFDVAATRVLELQGKVAPELARLMSLIAPEMAMPAEPEKRLAAHSASVDGGAQPVRRLGHRGIRGGPRCGRAAPPSAPTGSRSKI